MPRSALVTGALRSGYENLLERLTESVGGPARRRVIVLLAAVLALQSADTATVGAVGADLEHSLRIGNSALGALASATLLMGVVGAIPGGMLADRFRRVTLLQGAILIWSAALVVGALSVSFGMLLITRVVLGLLVAAAGPSIASLTGDLFAPGERARIYGFILAGEIVGGAVGFLVSGEIASVASWRTAFAVMAVPGVVLAYAIHRLLPEPERAGRGRLEDHGARAPATNGGTEPAGGAREQIERAGVQPRPPLVLSEAGRSMSIGKAVRFVLSIPTNRRLIVASSLGYFFLTGLQTFAVVFVRHHFGVGQGTATALLAAIVIFSVAGAVGGGRVADRLLRRRVLNARIVVPGVAYVLATVAFAPGLAVKSLAIAAPLYTLGALLLASTNPPLDAARLDIVPGQLWGRAEGVRTVVRSVCQAAAPFCFGVVSEALASGGARTSAAAGLGARTSAHGLGYTLLIMLTPLLISGLIMLHARRTYPRDARSALESDKAMESARGQR